MSTLLFVLVLMPLVSALLMVLLDAQGSYRNSRVWALLSTLGTLALALGTAGRLVLEPIGAAVNRGPIHPWISVKQTWFQLGVGTGGKPVELELVLGMDGIAAWMVLVVSLLSTCAVLVSWESIKERSTEFYAGLLALETGLIGVACSFDLLLFYTFFEFTLIPLFLMIGVFSKGSLRDTFKVFLLPLAGSLLTLVGIVALATTAHSMTGVSKPFSMAELGVALAKQPLPIEYQTTIFLLLAAGMIVKLPLVPFHTWLPVAHFRAPIAGSVLLIKLGLLGLLRLCVPMLPLACQETGLAVLAVLAAVGVVYGSLGALAQDDFNRVLAYGSVAHVGVAMLGLMAMNTIGLNGAVMQLINLGLSTGGLFLLAGMLQDRFGTRDLRQLGGLSAKLPMFATCVVFLSFASIGLPGLNGFVGEVLSLMGMFEVRPWLAAAGALGMALGAWYLLSVIQTLLFGGLYMPVSRTASNDVSDGGAGGGPKDLVARELFAIVPVMAACLVLGLCPQLILGTIEPDVKALLRRDLPVEEVVTATEPGANWPVDREGQVLITRESK